MTTRGRKRHRPEQIIAKLRDEEESKRRHPQFVAEPKMQTPTICSLVANADTSKCRHPHANADTHKL